MRTVAPNEARPAEFARAIRDLVDGGTSAGGAATLAASATETTIDNALVRTTSRILLTPTSANGAAAQAYVKSVADGSFKIGHTSTAATDKTFNYEVRRP